MPRKDKDIIVSGNSLQNDESYQALLQELKSIIAKGHYEAYKTVDNIKVQTYWQIGERIVREELQNKDRADYGKFLIKKLAVDLNIKWQRLYEITKFYKCYPIFRTLSGILSWSHYIELCDVSNKTVRDFYEKKAIQHSWSVRELRKQIKSELYENTSPEEIQITSKSKLPTTTAVEIFKNTYNFNFLKLENKKEKELEDKLVANIENFLKELGHDFAFVGRQIPIKIDTQTHYIDLVFYHRGIPCNILVDIKIGKLNSRDIGQINKYIGYYRRNNQYEHEKDTIGLIICEEAEKDEVIYALDGLEEKIFISTYKTKLPSEKKIKSVIRKIK